MKGKIFCFLAGACLIAVIAATVPVRFLLLDSDADGGGHSFTNLANVQASTITVPAMAVNYIIFTNNAGFVSLLFEAGESDANLWFNYGDTNGVSSFLQMRTNGAQFQIPVSVDPTHAFIASNATASAIATFDALKQLTNGAVAARLSFSGNVLDLASGVVSAGTYRSVTLDTYGRATSGSNPTTFSAYGISDSSANLASALTDESGTGLVLFSSRASEFTNEVTRQINSPTNIYPSLGTAVSAIESATNLSYIIKTNNGGGNALVSGAPGTALTCILTNITADTTLAAMTFWTGGLSVIPLYASCSGGANKQLKFPANFTGDGTLFGTDVTGTGVTITNGGYKWFEIRCIYGVMTNVLTPR